MFGALFHHSPYGDEVKLHTGRCKNFSRRLQ
jgi:hypothetical protein